MSFTCGITEKKYPFITETLTGEVSAKTGKLCKSYIKKYFVTPKVNLTVTLTVISFDKR